MPKTLTTLSNESLQNIIELCTEAETKMPYNRTEEQPFSDQQ